MNIRYYILFIILISALLQANDSDQLIDSAKTLNNIGRDHYLNGDYKQASLYYKLAISLKRSIEEISSSSIANSINNLALVYSKFWNYDSAIVLLNQAEELYKIDSGQEDKLANVRSNMARIKLNQGDYELAELYIKEALSILSKENNIKSVERRKEAHNLMAIIKKNKKKYNEAMFYARKALIESELLPPEHQGTVYKSLAYYHFLLGDSAQCFKYLSKCSIEWTTGPKMSTYFRAMLYRDYGEYYTGFGNYKKAEYYFKKTEQNFESCNCAIQEKAELYRYRAILYSKQAKYDLAHINLQKALEIYSGDKTLKNNYKNPSFEEISAKMSVLKILQLKNRVLLKEYKASSKLNVLESSLSTSELAIRLIEDLRLGYQSHESKLFLAENEHSFFEQAIYAAWRAYSLTQDEKYIDKAFLFTEKSKSSILLSSLRESKALSSCGLPDALLNKEKVLNREISFYKQQIYEEKLIPEPDTSKLNTWQNYLYSYTKEYGDLKQHIEKHYPRYYQLKHNTSVASVTDVQALLDRKSAVIEYALLDSLLLSFTITKRNVTVHSQKIDSSFYTEVNEYLRSFKEFDFLNQGVKAFNKFNLCSNSLYNYLLKKPLENTNVSNLVIVADGSLAYIPFESLLIDLPASSSRISYNGMNLALNHYNINYSFSSTLLNEVSGRMPLKRNNARLLAVAPDYSHLSKPIPFELMTRQVQRADLSPIPGAKEEVEAIASLINSDLLIDKEATERNFRRYASEYDLLHLAMHTIIDNTNPMYSKLLFSEANESSEDGSLNTNEIYSLSLNSSLAVLSSCSTGEGKINKGEGVVSLARGFFYAGCPSLVMTLWEVEDKSGVVLMKYFYENLISGQSKSNALRNAKIKYLKNSPPHKTHPFFWSTYISLGNNAPIFHNKKGFFNFYIFPVLALMIILLFIFRRRKLIRRQRSFIS